MNFMIRLTTVLENRVRKKFQWLILSENNENKADRVWAAAKDISFTIFGFNMLEFVTSHYRYELFWKYVTLCWSSDWFLYANDHWQQKLHRAFSDTLYLYYNRWIVNINEVKIKW